MSLVGFKARNHPQQAERDDVNDRRTPDDLFDELHAKHRFTVDAAASAANAKLPRFWSVEDSGLDRSWRDERVWCNPPYTGLKDWAWKADHEARHGCALIVMLLPANRCEQGWWQDYIEPTRDRGPVRSLKLTTRFLRGRLRFGYPDGTAAPEGGFRPPFGCVLVTWKRTGGAS